METKKEEPHVCGHCKTVETWSHPLKRCAGCHAAWYCHRDCQKAAWKLHKKQCDTYDEAKSDDNTKKPKVSTKSNPMNVFEALKEGTWLENRPERELYGLLVDAYRLRVNDEAVFGRGIDEDSFYGGINPLEGFSNFLKAAERTRKPLPGWWTPAKTAACERWAAEQTTGQGKGVWHNLSSAVGKSDIVEHYSDPIFPMQLRLLAEDIKGYPVGGGIMGTGAGLLAAMSAAGANGLSRMTHLSLS